MFMASRYFATVRRATGIPDDLSRSASLASESGLRGFSSSIRRRIIAWMAVLDASPPLSVSMPEAKKARSGRVPRGVRTCLRAIALIWAIFARDLPSVDQLRDYEPALPTMVRDGEGKPVAARIPGPAGQESLDFGTTAL